MREQTQRTRSRRTVLSRLESAIRASDIPVRWKLSRCVDRWDQYGANYNRRAGMNRVGTRALRSGSRRRGRIRLKLPRVHSPRARRG